MNLLKSDARYLCKNEFTKTQSSVDDTKDLSIENGDRQADLYEISGNRILPLMIGLTNRENRMFNEIAGKLNKKRNILIV